MSVLIKNARIIDAKTDKFGCVGVDGEKIDFVGFGNEYPNKSYDIATDADGCAVMPAFTDMHCHLRDPGQTQKESMETGMRAAIKGGYSTLAAMANTSPVIDTPELVAANLAKAEKLGLCELIQAAACGKNLSDQTATDRRELRKFTNFFSNDGKTIFSDSFMERLLADSKRFDFVVSTHCQPEEETVARDLALLEKTGGNLHVGHISSQKTAELIRKAKKRGLPVTCEVTPHHLVGHDCGYKVNPPLLTEKDNRALVEAVADGTADCLSTDHAPHTPQDKTDGMAGISNIEYAFQIFLKVFDENKISLSKLSEMLSYRPRQILKLGGGLIEKGAFANIVIADLNACSKIEKAKMISRSNNTPFDGMETKGLIKTTLIKGKIIYDNGRIMR